MDNKRDNALEKTPKKSPGWLAFALLLIPALAAGCAAPQTATPQTATPAVTPVSTVEALAPNLEVFNDAPGRWSQAAENSAGQHAQLKAGESVSFPLDIDSAQSVQFPMVWSVKETPVYTLTAPDGQVIDEAYAAGHAEQVQFMPASFYNVLTYIVKNPSPGRWTVNITAAAEGNYSVYAALQASGLLFSAARDKDKYQPGETMTLGAQLNLNGAEVSAVTVSAEIISPDGTRDTLALTDLGDGRYVGTYRAPDGPQKISISFLASGKRDGIAFTRSAGMQIGISAAGLKLTGAHADSLGTEANGDKYLDVQVGISSAQAGAFVLEAQLSTPTDSVSVVRTEITLVPGDNTVHIQFPAYDILINKQDGPYTVRILTIYEPASQEMIDLRDVTWQTGVYQLQDFRP